MTTNSDRNSVRPSQSVDESIDKSVYSRDAISAKIAGISSELDEMSKQLSGSLQNYPMVGRSGAEGTLEDRRELASRVRLEISSRRERANHFPGNIFADPAWDMLLNLFHSDLLQHRTSTTDLSIASQVPQSTALRWIATLVKVGLVTRRPDPLDGRRVYIELTSSGRNALHSYFASACGAALSRSSLKAVWQLS